MVESLGKTLKKIRESKQLSLGEVSERTRIPKNIISSIEEDRLHEISSAFYARGFVRSYSRFLGALEEKKVIEYLSGGQKKDGPRLILKDERVPGDWFIKYKRQIGLAVLAVFCAYLVIFSFAQMGKFVRNACARYKTQAAERKKEKEARAAMPLAPKETRDKVSVAADAESRGVELEITARYNTWVQVVSDGTLSFRGAMIKGTSDIWRAEKKIELELGNAGGVTLNVNGKDLGHPGKKGEKKRVVVTKDGIKD